MTNLQDELERDYAEAWKPAEGESIIGTVVDVTEREGTFGPYPIVTLRTGDGEFAVHAFHEVLAGELARVVAPSPGDELGIRYVGKHPERGCHRYKVRRAGETADVKWSRYSGGTEAAQDEAPADESAAVTQAALEQEREKRDEAASKVHAPLVPAATPEQVQDLERLEATEAARQAVSGGADEDIPF